MSETSCCHTSTVIADSLYMARQQSLFDKRWLRTYYVQGSLLGSRTRARSCLQQRVFETGQRCQYSSGYKLNDRDRKKEVKTLPEELPRS